MRVMVAALLAGAVLIPARSNGQTARPGVAPPNAFYCQITVQVARGVAKLFVTRVFQSEVTDINLISPAWDRYIVNKYAPDQQQLVDPRSFHPSHCFQARWTNPPGLDTALRGGAIQVDWRYTPDQTPPAVSPARDQSEESAPRPATHTMYCSTVGAHEGYFSDNFEVPALVGKSATLVAKMAFAKFLEEQYSVRRDNPQFWRERSTGCGGDAVDKAKTEATARQQGKKIIETGWKYAGPWPGLSHP